MCTSVQSRESTKPVPIVHTHTHTREVGTMRGPAREGEEASSSKCQGGGRGKSKSET